MADTPTNQGSSRSGPGMSRLASLQAQFQHKLMLEKEHKLSNHAFQTPKSVTLDKPGARPSLRLQPGFGKHSCSSPKPPARATPNPSPLISISSPYNLRKPMTATEKADIINHNVVANGAKTSNSPKSSTHQIGIGRTSQDPSLRTRGVHITKPQQKLAGLPAPQTETPQVVNGNEALKLKVTETKTVEVNTPKRLTRGRTFTKPKPTFLVLPTDSNIGPGGKQRNVDCDILNRAADTSTGSDTPDESDPSPRPVVPPKDTKSRSVPTQKLSTPSGIKPEQQAAPSHKNTNGIKGIDGSSTLAPSCSKPRPSSFLASSSTPKSGTNTPILMKKTAKTFLKIIRTEPPPPGTVPCSNCGRCFLEERVAKHEAICKKTSARKRKVFDPTKIRVAGTEAEAYLKLASIKKSTKASGPSASTTVQKKKPDWRQKHEDFIRTIRAAKEYQQHIAAGRNPKDLPPPPPSDYSDYVQCPHCKRKFNEGAAERHIPKCTSNKNRQR